MADNDSPWWTQHEQSREDPRIGVLHIKVRTAPRRPALSLEVALAYALAALAGGPADDLKRAFARMDEDEIGGAYRQTLEAAAECDGAAEGFREAFHLAWTVRGFRHRAALQDDALFLRAFRRIFPPYQGEPLILYRGERTSELEAGRIGFNWSTKEGVGRMFASGLCTTYGGDGVLLRASAAPQAILSGPNDHSANWLGEMEHIVDPAMLTDVIEIARFPPSA